MSILRNPKYLVGKSTMSRAVSLHQHFYNLLKVRKMNHFTVTEFRDAVIADSQTSWCKDEARKFVYRRLLLLVRKRLLHRTGKKHSPDTLYSTTKLFSQTVFKVKNTIRAAGEGGFLKVPKKPSDSFLTVLQKEKVMYKTDLRFATEEMEVFECLIQRFPEQKEFIEPFFHEAKVRSAQLYSHVSALSKILNINANGLCQY